MATRTLPSLKFTVTVPVTRTWVSIPIDTPLGQQLAADIERHRDHGCEPSMVCACAGTDEELVCAIASSCIHCRAE